jgi:hypothetical protein
MQSVPCDEARRAIGGGGEVTLLTIALFVDAFINILRIIEVERGMKMQARWLSNRDKEMVQVIAALTGADKDKP